MNTSSHHMARSRSSGTEMGVRKDSSSTSRSILPQPHVSSPVEAFTSIIVMEKSQEGPSGPRIIQWLLDTRSLWPVRQTASPKEAVQELKTVASRALSLLSESEQASVLRYYFVKDAKMSLASHLLKHLIIAKYCSIPWSRSAISRDANGKPCFTPPDSNAEHGVIDFNVSHQAGIVSLIASIGFKEKVHVGTDVVCADERLKQDYAHIDKSGFFDWIDMHRDVFSESELNHMKLSPVPIEIDGKEVKLRGFGNDALSRCQWRNEQVKVSYEDPGGAKAAEIGGDVVINKKLRRFYGMWCLRETYVKMTGEALLAPWLKDLEIADVQPPAAKQDIQGTNSLEVGEVKRDFAIFFHGKKVNDVKMELTAFGSNYMVGGSLRVPKGEHSDIVLADWIYLDIEKDVLKFAESSL